MVGVVEDYNYFNILVKYNSDLTIVVNQEGRCNYASDAITALLGYEPEEFTGSSIFEHLHLEDLPFANAIMEAIALVPSLKLPVFKLKTKAGEWRWLETTVTNMLHHEQISAFIANIRDVTESHLAEVLCQKNNAYYQALFYNHPDIVFALTVDGQFSHTNEKAGKITGYASGQLTGVHFSKIVHASFLSHITDAFNRALAGEASMAEGKILKKNKAETGDFNITLVPVVHKDRVVGIQGIAKEVTTINRANELVREYAEQLDNILESITEAFFEIDAIGNLTYANTVFTRYFGKEQPELKGNNLWKLQPALLATDFYIKCRQVLQSGESLSCIEYVHAFKAYLNFSIYATKNGLAVYFNDITDRKKAQQELEQLSLVASKTTNGVIITDTHGAIEWVNDGFTRLTGFTLPEVAGKKPGSILQGRETNQEVVDDMRRLMASRQPFTREVLNYNKAGECLWLSLEVTPVHSKNGAPVKYMAIQTDITEYKKAEEHLLQITDDLYKQNRELQQFTYIVSHNLHGPVSNAIGLANLLKKAPPASDSFQKAMENMEKNILNLDAVIKDLTSILDFRKEKSTPGDINVATVVQEVLRSHEESIQATDAAIVFAVPDNLVLRANKAYLYSIVQNLLTNALKFRDSSRILEVKINATQDKNGITLVFEDNGVGMDLAKVQPNMFKLYKRFHPEKEGRGLGLYMVKTQVEALGGTIKVNSKAGSGTTFTLNFTSTQNHGS